MKTEIQDKFVFSERNATMFGYNIGMTRDGKKFSYTTVINEDRRANRPEYEIEGDIVYVGKVEDLIAIKRYSGKESQYIKNNTDQIDPLTSFEEKVIEQKHQAKDYCDMTKNFCNKVKELNKKFMKNIEKEFNNSSNLKH